MKAQDRTIKDWISEIRQGKLVLPRFQRFESWGSTIIADFLTSVARNLPVGVSLILQAAGKPQFKYRYFYEVNGNENVKELLLDGQQRLTALWRSFKDNYKNKTYLLDLDTEEDSDISAIAVSRWISKKNGQKYPLWVDDPKECWNRKKIPFRILNPDDEIEYFDWCNEAVVQNKRQELLRKIISIRQKILTFNIPYLNLDADTLPDVAIDVFVKLNTSFVRLTPFDIIVAQVEEATDQSLHQKVKELELEVPQINAYIDTSTYVLSVSALLQDKLPNQRGFFALDLKKMINDWPKVIEGTSKLVSLLKEQRVFDSERLPTETILAPIAALLSEKPTDPDKEGILRLILRKYLWRSFFTERYDRSIPTRILQDFRIIKRIIDSTEDEDKAPIFNEKLNPLPNIELLEAAGWPKKKERLARAILLLSFKKGAKDFADDSEINKSNIKLREYHHIFPNAFLQSKGFGGEQSGKALNCALITWKTNRVISDKEPIKYLLERSEAASLGEEEIKYRLSTHLIEYSDLLAEDYSLFVENRAKALNQKIIRLCKGIEWD